MRKAQNNSRRHSACQCTGKGVALNPARVFPSLVRRGLRTLKVSCGYISGVVTETGIAQFNGVSSSLNAVSG